jgi:nitrite reductase/ring-hydroxylating ferredoxin subunit
LVRHGLKRIVLFKLDDGIHALNDLCPHAGGHLSQGRVVGPRVICPRHDMGFEIRSGHCAENDIYCATSYPVRVEGDEVWIGIRLEIW